MPKIWDTFWTVHGLFGCCWAGNGHGFQFHKVEPMLGERAAHRQPTARLGTVKKSPGLLDLIENVHVFLHTIA